MHASRSARHCRQCAKTLGLARSPCVFVCQSVCLCVSVCSGVCVESLPRVDAALAFLTALP